MKLCETFLTEIEMNLDLKKSENKYSEALARMTAPVTGISLKERRANGLICQNCFVGKMKNLILKLRTLKIRNFHPKT